MHAATSFSPALAILFALLTAFTNALALTAQHIASTRQQHHDNAWRLFLFLLRQPLWFLGWLALCGSLVFQALALHFGPMSEVQPLLVAELIIALLLRRVWLRQRISLLAWLGAVVTVGGLAAFLLASSPSGIAHVPSNSHWIAPTVTFLFAIALFNLLGQRGSPNRRGGLFAAATGAMWALEATFIKATTDVVAQHGYVATLARWPLYALIVGGIIGLLCEQAAVHVGELRVTQPIIVIIDPLGSVLLGVWLYGEQLQSGVGSVSVATLGFLVMCAGVLLVTQRAPSSMRGELHRV